MSTLKPSPSRGGMPTCDVCGSASMVYIADMPELMDNGNAVIEYCEHAVQSMKALRANGWDFAAMKGSLVAFVCPDCRRKYAVYVAREVYGEE